MSYTIVDSLTFDDVLLKPKYSEITSRSDVDISINIGEYKFDYPIISANMKNITGLDMAKEILKLKGLGIVHRFMPIEEQCNIAKELYNINNSYMNYIGFSLGVKPEDKENLAKLIECGVKIFCIDIAHGDSISCIDMIKYIKRNYSKTLLVAGNIASGEGSRRLWEAGSDINKIGIGAGSICLSRIEAAAGVPQLSAIIDVAEVRDKYNLKDKYFISDGGIKSAGDIGKSLCFADMCMAGNIFAGCKEAPGKTIKINDIEYKEYHGSSTFKSSHIEGVKAIVQTKQSYKEILDKLLQGLRSCCSYQGVNNLIDLKKNPTFVKITNAGLIESNHHDVKVIQGDL